MFGAASRISFMCASLNHLFVGTPVLNVSFLNDTICISIPACSAAYAYKAFVTYSSMSFTFTFLSNKSLTVSFDINYINYIWVSNSRVLQLTYQPLHIFHRLIN